MIQKLWVPGPLPGQNEIVKAAKGFKGKGLGYSRQKKNWTETIAWLARAARLQPVERAFFHFSWVEVSQRRDPDNVVAAKKFILDGLVTARVLPGDRWKHVAGFSDSWAVGPAPGVWVTIEKA